MHSKNAGHGTIQQREMYDVFDCRIALLSLKKWGFDASVSTIEENRFEATDEKTSNRFMIEWLS